MDESAAQGRAPDRPEISGSQQFQYGDKNLQVNISTGTGRPAGPLVVGDVPQEPAAFQLRAGLMEALAREPGDRGRVVFAVTGIRGVGKTQIAAACARRRIAEGWRLVAWVDAGDEALLLSGLAQVAAKTKIGTEGEDVRVLAAGVRHWLETDGDRRLLVFDNATDLDVLRPFLPAAGAAQVIVTSSRRPAAALGQAVPVDVFSGEEGLAFLEQRTGLDDAAGAEELARELGFLPLGLAQAAALIARERLSYGTYLGRLRSLPVKDYLRPTEGDTYPYRLAEAIELSLNAVAERDPSGGQARLMGLVAVLAETGVPRDWLHQAAETAVSGEDQIAAVQTDAAVGDLADASLLGFSVDGASVTAHRLVMRVIRERLAAEGRLMAVAEEAARVLARVAKRFGERWRDRAAVRDLAGQVVALVNCLTAHPTAFAGGPADLLKVRQRLVLLLIGLGDSTELAVAAAEPLAADFERLLGPDHLSTVMSRGSLAAAYRAAGRSAEAAALYERILADRARLLGASHPSILTTRTNLGAAYTDVGRTAEAIPLLEQALAGFERVFGPDHPGTLTTRNNLAEVYQAAGRTAEATVLHEQTLVDRERLLGTAHPDALVSRTNLGAVYQAAGRTAEAIPLLEQGLAAFERLLGPDHPKTQTARTNLVVAYKAAGRTAEAIALLEQALAAFERLLGNSHPNTKRVRGILASLTA